MGKKQNKTSNQDNKKLTREEQLLMVAKHIGIDMKEIDNLNLKELPNNIKSPYNFVSFDENLGGISAYNNSLPDHNSINDELFNNGYIDIEIKTTSPLIVAKGKINEEETRTPMQDSQGDFIIPASTFRGLIRQHCKILSLSNLEGDIDGDKYLTYRALASNNSLKIDYEKKMGIRPLSNNSKVRIPFNVKAGYMNYDGNNYFIYPAKQIDEKTYYPIHEGDLLATIDNPKDINTMYKDMKARSDFNNRKDFLDYYKEKTLDKKHKNSKFEQYYQNSVKFDFKENNITKVIVGKGEGSLLCSGYIGKKKRHILINPIDGQLAPIQLTNERIDSYNNFLKVNKISEKFYLLSKKGESKPCFYIETNGKMYFGFTPYLRLFFDFPIKNGVPNKGKKTLNGYDWTESIFGFSNSNKNIGYKSRLSFCDFKASNAQLMDQTVSLVLGSPKPTFFKYYLKQDDQALKTYNSVQFRLRGFKNYWLKADVDKGEDIQNKKIITTFIPLEKDALFKGRIYFNQLKKEELGLILWAIKIKDNSEYNIGLAKAYGYGSFKVTSIKLGIEDYILKYEKGIINDYVKTYENENLLPFIDSYKKIMEKNTDIKLEKRASIKEFIALKTFKVRDSDSNRFKYLNLQDHKTTEPLPYATEFYKYLEEI